MTLGDIAAAIAKLQAADPRGLPPKVWALPAAEAGKRELIDSIRLLNNAGPVYANDGELVAAGGFVVAGVRITLDGPMPLAPPPDPDPLRLQERMAAQAGKIDAHEFVSRVLRDGGVPLDLAANVIAGWVMFETLLKSRAGRKLLTRAAALGALDDKKVRHVA